MNAIKTLVVGSFLAITPLAAGCAAQTDGGGEASSTADVTDISQGLTSSDLHIRMKPVQRMDPAQRATSVHHLVPGSNGTPGDQSALHYNGGPIMNRQNVYAVYYGDWSRAQGTQALHSALFSAFQNNSFESDYVHLFPYRDQFGGLAGRDGIGFGGAYSVGYPYGTQLNDQSYASLLQQLIWQKKLPYDPNGLFLFFPSRDVVTAGQDKYCGWHTAGGMTPAQGSGQSAMMKFGMIVHSSAASCSAFRLGEAYPNGDYVADSQATVIAHEMAETLTDPEITAWWNPDADGSASEVGDKCAWYFPNTRQVAGGAFANMHDRATGRNWLLQAEFANGCSLGGAH